MNIGFDAKRFFLNKTGLGNYSRDLVKGLLEYYPNHHYYLFTPSGGIDIQNKFLKNNSSITVVVPKGIIKYFKSIWRTLKLEKYLIKNGIEVYHGLSHEIPKKNKDSKIKYVVTIHDLIFMRYPENYSTIDRKIYKKKVTYACENADVIVAISEQTKRDVIEFLNISAYKIKVVYQTCGDSFKLDAHYSYVESVRKKYNLPQNFILNVGTIEKRKNLVSLVESIGKSNTKLPLVAIGAQTDYLKEVEAKVTEYKLDEEVAFLQNVSFMDLPAIYQMANLFVYPSVFEGFGIPVLEALYSRTPVIAASGSCLEEVGGKHTIYVDPLNTDEIAKQIDRVIESDELQLKMKEEGYRFAQKFSSENQAKELIKIYESLI
jgi:glycosyltransferase involved in cell wall biosynthesis